MSVLLYFASLHMVIFLLCKVRGRIISPREKQMFTSNVTRSSCEASHS